MWWFLHQRAFQRLLLSLMMLVDGLAADVLVLFFIDHDRT